MTSRRSSSGRNNPGRGATRREGPRDSTGLRAKAASRRDFLKGAATAAGAFAIGASSSCAGGPQDWQKRAVPKAGKKRPLGDKEAVRIGMIGVGGMGGGHLGALLNFRQKKEENLEIAAICDVNQIRLDARLEQARSKQGIAVDGYRDYKKLLEREDLHAVLIASPEHWHAQMAVDAIAAGKDVYLEKPMTLRLDDALWLKRVMEENPQMILQVGTQYMMQDKYLAAREIIADGGIGHPTFSQTSYCRNSKNGEWLYHIDKKVLPGTTLDWERWCGPLGVREWDTEIYHRWRRYRDYSTGIIGDLLVHQMTPLIHAIQPGWPVRVTASGGHYCDKKMENHDQVNLTIEFEKEHTMIVAGSTCNEKGLEILVRGHEANIYLGGSACVMRPERIFADDIDAKTIQSKKGWGPQDKLRKNWLHSVRTRKPNRSPVSLGALVMVIVDLATRSMWGGGAYRFDPASLTVSKA